MKFEPPPPAAKLDRRLVNLAGDDQPGGRISQLADLERWVLFGEPGSGKSTVFEQAAADAGTEIVNARDFVAGCRPAGQVVFIDALEEYRISDPGRDRLDVLVSALKAAPYSRWRIACRAVSLPKPDLVFMTKQLGGFEAWQLAHLDVTEQRAVLESLGEPNPAEFIRRIAAMAASALLGNPATLKLLHTTALKSVGPIHTRGALLAAATKLMADEVNPELPDQPGRPTSSEIIEAAEKACLVLMLSARNEIWIDRGPAPHALAITKDDLRPSGIDTEALSFALDTPMFRGAGGSFKPTHRIVAEYLAGRALAAAVSAADGKRAALPIERAVALLSGKDGKPAPALAGTFAWFVAAIAGGVHQARAMELMLEAPEAVLLQGDAAMLPPAHRKALLDATGHQDPWFLAGSRGSTAVGGLAGDDLQAEFMAILRDKAETPHRQAMILDALASGAPMTSLLAAVTAFILDPGNPDWLRREALSAVGNIAVDAGAARRAVVDGLVAMTDDGSVLARVDALAELVGIDATADEVRRALTDYEASTGSVMGYGYSLGIAIERTPITGLFDQPMPGRRHSTRSRSVEVESIVERALAASIARHPSLSATELLRWLANANLRGHETPDEKVRRAIATWLRAADGREEVLFWTLHAESGSEAWRSVSEFHRMTGSVPPEAVKVEALNQLEAIKTGEPVEKAVALAFQLISGHDDAELYWRFWELLAKHPTAAGTFTRFTTSTADDWRVEQAKRKADSAVKRAASIEKDRAWVRENIVAVRTGSAVKALAVAAEAYAGHWEHITDGTGFERVANWIGEELAEDVLSGWAVVSTTYADSVAKQAGFELKQQTENKAFIPAVWTDHQISTGNTAGLTLEAAFAALRATFIFNDAEQRDRIVRAAVAVIEGDPNGAQALAAFWSATAKLDRGLLHSHLFGDKAVLGVALETFVAITTALTPSIIRSVLSLAARVLSRDRVKKLIADGLKTRPQGEARSTWKFAELLIDPVSSRDVFDKDIAGDDAHALLDRLSYGDLISAFDKLAEAQIERDLAVIQNLGKIYDPSEDFATHKDRMSDAIAGAIKRLAVSPVPEATAALEILVADAGLSKWRELLRHELASQQKVRQDAEFRPPAPIDVARAIVAGPPATPADLRAVVREILADLARDIRSGDTSGWRGFWNHFEVDEKALRRPKVENDCRDLLTDRIRDRLIRFGLHAKRTGTEVRSIDYRRVDLLVVGEGDAALPIEAKRHMNDEVWTAPNTQIEPYSVSAGSDGHAIYLIFWFGTEEAGGVPKTPQGLKRIKTPEALGEAIVGVLSPEQRAKIDVVVLDLSPPPPKDIDNTVVLVGTSADLGN